MSELGKIEEWRPTDFSTLQPLEIVLAAGLYVALTRGARLPPVRLLILLGLLHLALTHTRHQALVGVILPLLLAGPLAAALPAFRRDRGGARWAAWGLGAAGGLVALRLLLPLGAGGNTPIPVAAVAHVPPALAAQPVFNDYSFGGYLIHAGIRPFIDSRADLYGPAFLRSYGAATSPNRIALEDAFRTYGVRWTLLLPESPVVQLLDLMPHWCRLYSDEVAVVHSLSC